MIMIVDMGSAEGITAETTGIALIITVITTGELMHPPNSIEELRLFLLVLTDEQLHRQQHCFYLVSLLKIHVRWPDALIHQLNRLSACRFSTPLLQPANQGASGTIADIGS